MRAFKLIVALAVVCLAVVENAAGEEIQYIVRGIGTGTLGSVPFTNQPFTFTMMADTENLQTLSNSVAVNNNAVTFELGSTLAVGTAGSTYLFKPPGFGAQLAYSQYLIGQEWDTANMYLIGNNLLPFDMISPLGPIAISGPSTVSLYMPTDLGGISMPTTSEVTFEAVVVPEPSALALAMIGAAALIRRRCKS
jgi:hypothetical protein